MVSKTKTACGRTLIYSFLVVVSLLLLTHVIVKQAFKVKDPDSGDIMEQLESFSDFRAESLKLPNISFLERLQSMQFDVNNGLGRQKKAPMDVLQELLRPEQNVASYNYTDSGFGIDRFQCTISFGHDSTTGPSKKVSMHTAAMRMIEFLAGVRVPQDFYQLPSKMRRTSNSSSVDEMYKDFVDAGNYIGVLQLFATRKKSQQPQYELFNVTGPSDSRNFTMVCTFEGLDAYGSGMSKKAAKQKAAESMWLSFSDK